MREMQRCRHRHIHTEVKREQRGDLEQNVEKCYSTGPHIHLYRLQLQGVPFSAGHHMMVFQELCNHANLYVDPGAHSFYSKVHACVLSCFSHVQLYMTLWTTACQAPLPVGLSRQKYWSGLPCPSPEDLPDPGIKPASLTSPIFERGSFTNSTTWEAQG